MISQTEICVIATLRILYSIRKYCILVKKKKEIDIDRVKKFCLHVFTSNIRLRAFNRELKQLRRRLQRQLQKTIDLMTKTTALHLHHAF